MTRPFDCVKCGAKHGMVVHDRITNKDTPLDMCYDCIFSGVKYNPIPAHIKIEDLLTVDPDQLKLQMQANEAQLIENADEWLNLTISSLKEVVEWIEKKKEKFNNENKSN